MRTLLMLVPLCLFSGAWAQAASIPVNFIRAELPPDSTTAPLPFLMNGTDDTLFLKFRIPDIDRVLAINSFTINVVVYDDGDQGVESARILFALPGPNLLLNSFSTLNGKTSSSPLTVTSSLSSVDINELFFSVTDGNFRIRIQRDGGDFFVAGGSASIDATLAPEPASIAGAAGGLLMLAGLCWRRRSMCGTCIPNFCK